MCSDTSQLHETTTKHTYTAMEYSTLWHFIWVHAETIWNTYNTPIVQNQTKLTEIFVLTKTFYVVASHIYQPHAKKTNLLKNYSDSVFDAT